ncbi:hypothetical protein QE410_003272 [Microbacterium sp. SORGH_AS 1204]|nr:hypothetical protein [Microbacterium sp. SORGH_AS_1204]
MPRSRWSTMIPSETSQMINTGPSSRARGQVMKRKRVPVEVRLSRVRTRYPAKKIARQILANSPGWNDTNPSETHTSAFWSVPRPGTNGSRSSRMPTSPDRYV